MDGRDSPPTKPATAALRIQADRLGLDDADLASLSSEQWVARVGEASLRDLGATADSPRTADDVLERIRRSDLEFMTSESTFKAYLSRAASDLESAVASAGRGRAGGYFVSAFAGMGDQETSRAPEVPAEETRARAEKEALLYPVLKSWLIERGYRAQDTSDRRRLGRWGNPDIVGMQIHEHLGAVELEILSIEAKVSADDWERWIFEAVSHRRFANRAYFAFAIPDELRGKVSEDQRYYAERFAVGVLNIVLANDTYTRLLHGHLSEAITADQADVIEVFSAPPHPVPMRFRKQLCGALEIDGLDALFRWGDAEV